MFGSLASGDDLTSDQCRDLDDDFFQSNPAAYWRSRIDNLVTGSAGPAKYHDGVGAQVVELGVLPAMLEETVPTDGERELQRRLDAFALRHHIAESLVRLVSAVLDEHDNPGGSIWAAIADDRTRTKEACDKIEARVADTARPLQASAFLVRSAKHPATDADAPDDVKAGLCTAMLWIGRAMDVIAGETIDANAGNNKLKHGLSVRARDDVRATLIATGPNADGKTLNLSAFESSYDVIDDISFEFLTREGQKGSPFKGSWESTELNLRLGPLLAESLMMSFVYAAVFATAAERHYEGRDLAGPEHPGLLTGPQPDALTAHVHGVRSPLTRPTGGGEPRPTVIVDGGQQRTLRQVGEGRVVTIIDDSGASDETASDSGNSTTQPER